MRVWVGPAGGSGSASGSIHAGNASFTFAWPEITAYQTEDLCGTPELVFLNVPTVVELRSFVDVQNGAYLEFLNFRRILDFDLETELGWEVFRGQDVTPAADPIPEPDTIWLLIAGVLLIMAGRTPFHRRISGSS